MPAQQIVLEQVATGGDQLVETAAVQEDLSYLVDDLRIELMDEIKHLQTEQGIEIQEWRAQIDEIKDTIQDVAIQARESKGNVDTYQIETNINQEVDQKVGDIHHALRDLKIEMDTIRNEIKNLQKDHVNEKKQNLAL